MSMLEQALLYLRLGLRPIPCRYREKAPIINDWGKYHTEPPTEADLETWWGNGQKTNIGTVIGGGIFVVDLDGGKEAEKLLTEKGIILPPNAPRVKTGDGYQVYLTCPYQIESNGALLVSPVITRANGKTTHVEIRANNFCVLPPSIHPDTHTPYEWVVPFEDRPPMAPQELLDLISAGKPQVQAQVKDPGWVAKALAGVGEGQRDNTCTKLAGYFLGKKVAADVVEEILCSTFAQRCKPPFSHEQVRAKVQSISRKEGTVGEDREVIPQHISRVADEFMTTIEGTPPKIYPTSFEQLDWFMCGGFAPGNLIYMGARPGVGKTAMALQIAYNVAKSGSRVLIVSREMENTALFRRMVAQSGRVPARQLRGRPVQTDVAEQCAAVSKELSKLPIWMTDQATSIGEITEMVAGSQSKNEGCLVIVDHLQLIRAPGAKGEKRAQVEAASQGLKTLAMQFKVPVLCMSTLSRPFDKKNPRPTTDSLRESGELEHDADIILLLHREFGSPKAECEVAKNRDGHVGRVNLVFEEQFLAFSYIEESTEVA